MQTQSESAQGRIFEIKKSSNENSRKNTTDETILHCLFIVVVVLKLWLVKCHLRFRHNHLIICDCKRGAKF